MNNLQPLENLRLALSLKPQVRNDRIIRKTMELTKDLHFFKKLIEDEGELAHFECCKYLRYEFCHKFCYVFHQHEPGNTFYVILQGRVSVLVGSQDKNDAKEKENVMTIERGESFGDRAIMMGLPRAASIFCLTDCHFAVLDYEKYKLLLSKAIEMRFR